MVDSKRPVGRPAKQLRKVAPAHARHPLRQVEAERYDFQRLGLFRDQLHDSRRAARLAPVEIRRHDFDFGKIARHAANLSARQPLKHDPEKWEPVFRKRSCVIKNLKRDADKTKYLRALVRGR
jgi:hypothetical protein